MATYRVVNKHHVRATIVEEDAYNMRGEKVTVRNQGPTLRFDVGALIEDLTPAELEAFPDRFVLVEDPVPVSRGAASSKASA